MRNKIWRDREGKSRRLVNRGHIGEDPKTDGSWEWPQGWEDEVSITQGEPEIHPSISFQDRNITQAAILSLSRWFIYPVFYLFIQLKLFDSFRASVWERVSAVRGEETNTFDRKITQCQVKNSPPNSPLNELLSENSFMNKWYLRIWLIFLASLWTCCRKIKGM